MSSAVKLSSALAGDENLNGLDAMADDLIEDRKTIRVAVIYFDTVKVVEKTDDDTVVPYVRIRRLVPLGTAKDVPAELQRLIQEADENRTGKPPLPFGAVEPHEVSE